MSETILIVDDDANLLSAMRRQLRARFTIVTAQGGEEALELVKTSDTFAAVLCDMRMGGINGIETLRGIRDLSPDTVRMMLTGNADMQTAVDAINDGNIFRFLTKPCPPDRLEDGLVAALGQYRLITAERELLEKTLAGSIKVLTDILALASPEGFGRGTRIRRWVKALAGEFLIPLWQLDLAAMLAPMGLISMPVEILTKIHQHLPLNGDEMALYEKSPETARNVITNIPRLGTIADIVYLQNKGFDGSGYPYDGPTGTDIPLGARILRVLNDLGDVAHGVFPTAHDFEVLLRQPTRYDPTVFAKIRAKIETNDGVGEGRGIRTVPASLLRPGLVLAGDVVSDNGRLVLAGLVQISESHVERLRNLVKLRYIKDGIAVLEER